MNQAQRSTHSLATGKLQAWAVASVVLAGGLLAACQSDIESAAAPLREDPSTVTGQLEAPTSSTGMRELEEARRSAAHEQQLLEEQEALLRQREELLVLEEQMAERERQLLASERALAQRESATRNDAEATARLEAELLDRERELAAERVALRTERARVSPQPESEPNPARTGDSSTGTRSTSRSEDTDAWGGDPRWRDGTATTESPDASKAAEKQPVGDQVPARAPVAGRLRAGMELEAEILEDLSSKSAKVGDIFRSSLARDLVDRDGTVIVPAGSTLIGSVVEARPLRQVGGQAALGLEFYRLVVPGQGGLEDEQIEIEATFVDLGRDQKRDKRKIAGAAAAGAILGRILGDGEAAIVGGIVGAAAGTAAVMKSKGSEVELPAGTRITLELTEVVTSSGKYGPVARPKS